MTEHIDPLKPITGSFSYRLEDILKATFLCRKTKPNYKAQSAVNIAVVAFMVLSFCSFVPVYGVTLLSGLRTPSPAFTQLLRIGFVVLLFLAVVAIFSVIGLFAPFTRLQIRRNYQANRQNYEREHELVVDTQALSVNLPDWKTSLGWSQIERLYEYPDGFLVIYGNDQCLVIPKRAFPDEEAMTGFRSLAQEGAGKEITPIQ